VLFERWSDWCSETVRQHPGDMGKFTRNLTVAFSTVRTSQPRGEAGGRVQSYAGLALVEGGGSGGSTSLFSWAKPVK
jgi:hypothetical protein